MSTRRAALGLAEAAVGGTAALRAAVELGILDQLRNGARTARRLAAELELDERVTARTLDALVELDILERSGDRYRLTAADPAWVKDFLTAWDALPDVLRDGAPRHRFDQHTTAEKRYPAVVNLLAEMVSATARAAADRLAEPGLRVLDVGAGAAPWSLALCRRHRDMSVTALDLPEVLAVTRRAVQVADLADRFEYLPGNVFAVDLPEGAYDLVLVGNVCHLFGPDRNRRLLARLAPTLVSGGTLAILDGLADDAPTPRSACYRLGLALRTPDGDVYPAAAYRDWLNAAGLEWVSAEPLSGEPAIHLIRARRP